ncbi:alpha/beta fold hydrolase [Streptomyces sp. NBC_01235]|uniref:alpha/beta fold hydrolase n=1 Tax=Streptomyces sp. NBC_01235 TaxID=2903788 RepID=UPI002E153704|nr:alpha/beta hydrolase [Streptomyces sp. NBC_01235]
MTPRTLTTPDGIHLSYRDESPSTPTVPARATLPPPPPPPPPPVLLLHGLAGHLGEWDDLTARLLADGHRVVRYDARGHGESTRAPVDMTRAAAVRDVVALLDELDLPPAILLGQSLGGLTALLTAAAHPSRVSSLILVEAGPAGGDPELPERIGSWLDGWPTPFPTFEQAAAFLGHEAWARGLDWRPDGTGHARVDRDTMVAAVAELPEQDYWDQWSRLTCPTLVVRGENGTMPPEEQREMRTRRPTDTHVTVIPDASHDVHLDRPDALHKALTTFLGTAPEPPEHARFAEYLRALDRVPPAEETPLIRRILTDPDRQMARSAVLRHLDRRAATLHRAADDTWKAWADPLAEAVRNDPFLTRRLQEWTLVHTVTAPAHPWDPAATPTALATASDWLQRRLTETAGVPAPALAFLAEHGRTRRVRAAAAAAARRAGTGTAAAAD